MRLLLVGRGVCCRGGRFNFGDLLVHGVICGCADVCGAIGDMLCTFFRCRLRLRRTRSQQGQQHDNGQCMTAFHHAVSLERRSGFANVDLLG
jgi:hypothetical protein